MSEDVLFRSGHLTLSSIMDRGIYNYVIRIDLRPTAKEKHTK